MLEAIIIITAANFFIGLVIAAPPAIGLIIAAMRRGSFMTDSKPRRLQSFTTECNQKETMKAIIRFAQQSDYKISGIDEVKGQLVLEESASYTSWGFFFPILVSWQPNNTTLVEIGIKSKLFQVGPIVSRRHEYCVNGIKAAIFAQGGN